MYFYFCKTLYRIMFRFIVSRFNEGNDMGKEDKKRSLKNRISGAQGIMESGAYELALSEVESISEAAKKYKLKGVVLSANQLRSKIVVLMKWKNKNEKITKERLFQAKLERKTLEKIKQIMRVSTRISLDRMQEALDIDNKTFNDKIFDWAEEFEFTIDGDYLVINKETVSDFIDSLDRQFDMWEKAEKERDGKI